MCLPLLIINQVDKGFFFLNGKKQQPKNPPKKIKTAANRIQNVMTSRIQLEQKCNNLMKGLINAEQLYKT